MSDLRSFFTDPNVDTQTFVGGSITDRSHWNLWQKPYGKTMAFILAIGQGGSGGAGAIAASGSAYGGGGGSSGAISQLVIPLYLLPDQLYISCGSAVAGSGGHTIVSLRPATTTSHILLFSWGGLAGGVLTPYAAGVAATVATLQYCPLASYGCYNFFPGLPGGTGGGFNAALPTAPTINSIVSGGSGGGGIHNTNGGTAGASIIAPSPQWLISDVVGGIAGSSASIPPTNGNNGSTFSLSKTFLSLGGSGGGATFITATGAGAVQSQGGDGGYGSGGGGNGGAITGSTPAGRSRGGDGFCLITCW